MHLVTKAYFNDFKVKNQLALDDSKSFEAFANFCVFSKFSPDKIDPQELVYEGDDPGVDGAMIFLDDRLISSRDELTEILGASRRDFPAKVVLTQVKSSKSWKKNEVDSFVANAIDLMSDQPAQPHSEHLANFREIFLAIFDNIGRIHKGRPSLEAFFASAAPPPEAVEIIAAFQVGREAFTKTGYFDEASFSPVHRDMLHELWQSTDGSVEATVPTVGYAPFPDVPNVTDAYVATITARNFIDRVPLLSGWDTKKETF